MSVCPCGVLGGNLEPKRAMRGNTSETQIKSVLSSIVSDRRQLPSLDHCTAAVHERNVRGTW